MSEPYVILVTGSRRISKKTVGDEGIAAIERCLVSAIEVGLGRDLDVVIRHGAARGFDAVCDELTRDLGLRGVGVQAYSADWDTHGKKAGHLRNQEMVDAGADICIAAPLHDSRGTWDCVRRAEKAGIPVVVLKLEEIPLTPDGNPIRGVQLPRSVESFGPMGHFSNHQNKEFQMGTVEDIFSGAGDVGGQGFPKLPQLRCAKVGDKWVSRNCTVLLTLTRLEAFTSEKTDEDFVAAEFTVDQVTNIGDPNVAHQQGSAVKAMWALEKTRNNKLTQRGEYEMRRCRAFFSAMVSQVGIVLTDENAGKLMAVFCHGAMGHNLDEADAKLLGKKAGEPYPSPIGTQVVCRLFDEDTRSDKKEHQGKKYATEAWSAPPKAA